MKNANPLILVVLLVLVMLAITSCGSNDERLLEMAREDAARQAETQRQASELQRQLAEGSRQLVESDAKAREKLIALQRDLRADQAEIGRQRNQLEGDRREIAAQRHRDPIVAAVLLDIGIVLACLLPLAVCIYVLRSTRRAGESDDALTELLVEELVAERPRLSAGGYLSLPAIDHQPVADTRGDGSHDNGRLPG
jgi:hypothetical protein